MTRKAILILVVCLSLVCSMSSANRAAAQVQSDKDVQALPKGTVGAGLFGAELGLLVPGLSRWNEPWAWAVFPTVGATAGSLLGYFYIDKPGREKIAIAALTTGLACMVPALMVTVNAKRHRYERDTDIIELTESETKKPTRTYGGFLLIDDGKLNWGLPELRLAFRSRSERAQTDPLYLFVTRRTSAEVVLVSGLF